MDYKIIDVKDITVSGINISSIPVIVIPNSTVLSSVRRILFLQNFCPASTKLLDTLENIFPDARIRQSHVVDTGKFCCPFATPVFQGTSSQQFRKMNQWWKDEAKRQLDDVGGGSLLVGQFSDVFLERAISGEYDLIAIPNVFQIEEYRVFADSRIKRFISQFNTPIITLGGNMLSRIHGN